MKRKAFLLGLLGTMMLVGCHRSDHKSPPASHLDPAKLENVDLTSVEFYFHEDRWIARKIRLSWDEEDGRHCWQDIEGDRAVNTLRKWLDANWPEPASEANNDDAETDKTQPRSFKEVAFGSDNDKPLARAALQTVEYSFDGKTKTKLLQMGGGKLPLEMVATTDTLQPVQNRCPIDGSQGLVEGSLVYDHGNGFATPNARTVLRCPHCGLLFTETR